MNRISVRQLLMLFLIICLTASGCNAQIFHKTPRNPERKLFGKSLTKKEVKVKEPRAVEKAKKTQKKKEDKLKKDYNNYVADSKKRAFKIQTADVQARMVQNQKDITSREKAKKKKTSSTTRKAGRKYKE
jgi:hypothetical protein